MRVQVNDAVAVGPTTASARSRSWPTAAPAPAPTARGGIVIRAEDFNPERIQLDDVIVAGATPTVERRRRLHRRDRRRARLQLRQLQAADHAPLTRVAGGLARESTTAAAPPTSSPSRRSTSRTSTPSDAPAKFDALAAMIVDNLQAPDLVALEEIQDNNGPTNDAVDATPRRRSSADRRHPVGRRPDLPVPPDQSRSTTRTAASRAATSASASSSAPTAG